MFSADETADVGIDLGTTVVEAVGSEEKSRFTGKIPKVTVEIRNVNPQAEAEVKKAWAEVRHKTEEGGLLTKEPMSAKTEGGGLVLTIFTKMDTIP